MSDTTAKYFPPNDLGLDAFDLALEAWLAAQSRARISAYELPAGRVETPDRAACRARWRAFAEEGPDLARNRLLRALRLWNPASLADVEDCDITAVFAEPFGVIRDGHLVLALPGTDGGPLEIRTLPLGSVRNLGPRISFAGVDAFGAG